MGSRFRAVGGQHGVGDIGIGGKAASADVGADGGMDVFGVAAKGFLHSPGGFSRNAQGGATPAGMGSANGAGNGIPQQDRGAIGGEYRQGDPRLVGDQGVALGILPMIQPPGVGGCDGTHHIGVDLPEKLVLTWPSIVTALNSIGATSSFAYRSKIAKANGIKAYVGTAKQNTTMLNLLKNGKLIKP